MNKNIIFEVFVWVTYILFTLIIACNFWLVIKNILERTILTNEEYQSINYYYYHHYDKTYSSKDKSDSDITLERNLKAKKALINEISVIVVLSTILFLLNRQKKKAE